MGFYIGRYFRWSWNMYWKLCWCQHPRSLLTCYNCGRALALTIKPLFYHQLILGKNSNFGDCWDIIDLGGFLERLSIASNRNKLKFIYIIIIETAFYLFSIYSLFIQVCDFFAILFSVKVLVALSSGTELQSLWCWGQVSLIRHVWIPSPSKIMSPIQYLLEVKWVGH